MPFCKDNLKDCRWLPVHRQTMELVIYSIETPVKIYFQTGTNQTSYEYLINGLNHICLCELTNFKTQQGTWFFRTAVQAEYELVPFQIAYYEHPIQCFVLFNRNISKSTTFPTLKQLCFATSHPARYEYISNSKRKHFPPTLKEILPLLTKLVLTLYLPPLRPGRCNRYFPTCERHLYYGRYNHFSLKRFIS